MKKIKYVFKESLAKRLSNNYPIVSIRRDLKDKNRYVFLFEETESFTKDFTLLSQNR